MKLDALDALRASRKNDDKRFPGQEDPRFQDQLLFPSLKPKFHLSTPAKVFTIGSCFARNIERALVDYDVQMPTQNFSVPESEWPHLPNGLLNEYNAGTIAQRILSAIGVKENSEETLAETKDGVIDLLLPGKLPVSYERAVARRAEIDEIYKELVTSDLVVVTLGLVEAWYDEKNDTFLNQMPTRADMKSQSGRYFFRRLDVFDSYALLDRAISELVGAGVDKILLTVSPVPLGTTFTSEDVVVANSFSKSVLRVCAGKLAEEHPQVDYFPSYEIVSSGGLNSFNPDNIHVQLPVVRRVTGHMLNAYFPDSMQKSETSQQAVSGSART